MVGVVVTRECLCLVPALIDSNSAMLEARPHPSYQWASGFARNARLAKPSEWARGSVRIRHSACSHQPSSFIPSPTASLYFGQNAHQCNLLRSRSASTKTVEPALGQLIGRYHTTLGQTLTCLGTRTDEGRK